MSKKLHDKIYTIVIVDDHEIFRQGLRTLIKKFESIRIIGSLTNGREMVKFLKNQIPDIIIMDINMPIMDGIAACRYVKDNYPDVKIIALTMYQDSYTIEKAFKAGATAFLTKAITKKTFTEAIEKVLDSEIYLSPDAAISYSTSVISKGKDFGHSENVTKEVAPGIYLTNRELEVIKLLGEGLTSKQIAERLSLSPRTVDKHRSNAINKLSVKNSSELVQVATNLKLI